MPILSTGDSYSARWNRLPSPPLWSDILMWAIHSIFCSPEHETAALHNKIDLRSEEWGLYWWRWGLSIRSMKRAKKEGNRFFAWDLYKVNSSWSTLSKEVGWDTISETSGYRLWTTCRPALKRKQKFAVKLSASLKSRLIRLTDVFYSYGRTVKL